MTDTLEINEINQEDSILEQPVVNETPNTIQTTDENIISAMKQTSHQHKNQH